MTRGWSPLLARRTTRRRGGFASSPAPRGGKSVTLRMLAERLAGLRDVQSRIIAAAGGNGRLLPQMGELFGVELHPHNRHGGAKVLRARWQGISMLAVPPGADRR